jgi:hypothetical protein
MEEQQDVTKNPQNPPPPDLGGKKKYIRKLLEAFEPHQDAMLADLDQQIEESNPDIILDQIDELNKKDKKLGKQLNKLMDQLVQKKEKASEEENAALRSLFQEETAISKEELTLFQQHRIVGQQNNILKHKREHLVKLLQTMHTMRQAGCWEKVGSKEKYTHEFVLIGTRFLCFDFTNHMLHYQSIEDIYVWMKQHRADFLPVEEAEEEESPPKKPAKTTQRKRPVTTKQPQPAVSPAQIYERQAWVRLLVSAHLYSSYFQDPLGELGVFVYDKNNGPLQATLHIWANGTKQQFPVIEGSISQPELLTDTMRSWLALSWEAATGRTGRREGTKDDAPEKTKSDTDQ